MPAGDGAGQRVGRDDRAGDLLRAVDAVGVAGDAPRCRARRPAPPRAPAGTRRCVRRGPCRAPSPWSRRPTAARRAAASGWPCVDDRERDAGHDLADLARLALERVAEDERRRRRPRAPPRPRPRATICGVAIMTSRPRGEPRVAGLRRLVRGALEMRAATAGGGVDAVALEDGAGVGEGRGVGHGRAGGDDRRIVARHVGDQQADDLGRMARPPRAGRP